MNPRVVGSDGENQNAFHRWRNVRFGAGGVVLIAAAPQSFLVPILVGRVEALRAPPSLPV
jgi:hypothetical protein